MHNKSRGSDRLQVDYHCEVKKTGDSIFSVFSLIRWACERICVTEAGSSKIWSKIAELSVQAFLELFLTHLMPLAMERDSNSHLFSGARRAFSDISLTKLIRVFHLSISIPVYCNHVPNECCICFAANRSHAVAKISSGLCLSSFVLHLHFDNREVIHHEFIITIPYLFLRYLLFERFKIFANLFLRGDWLGVEPTKNIQIKYEHINK